MVKRTFTVWLPALVLGLSGLAPATAHGQSASRVGFAQSAYVADEVTPPGVPRQLTITRSSNAMAGAASVTVTVRGGTATLGADFSFASTPGVDHIVVTWSEGDSAPKHCEYRIVNDAQAEGGEEIQFALTDPVGVDLDAATSRTRTWIYDDDYPGAPVLRQAAGHDILYYLSLPKDWSPAMDAPVLFSIDGAGGWYRGMEETFRTARGERPFILVTPITRSNGAPWAALSEYYPTDLAGAAARFNFDEAGLLAIWADLRSAGITSDARFYLTGHSGGGLVAYRMVFQHPALLFAVAPTCPNYWASAIDHVSMDPARATLPLTVIQGLDDPYLPDHMEPEWQLARRALMDNGFRQVDRLMIPGGHDPFADRVLELFSKHASERSSARVQCYLPFGLR